MAISNINYRCLEPKRRHKTVGDHEKFLERIRKTLYYGKLPVTDRLSLPVTEYASEIFSEIQYGRSLKRLHCDVAATISRNTCISPCSLVLALMYLDRLKVRNPEYLSRVAPSDLFLVSLMVSSKFLNDDGEDSEVFTDEWAASAGITVPELIQMEKEFLNAIQWEVFANEKTFWSRLKDLEHQVALRQGNQRGGWFTYTDLQYLLNDIEIYNLVQYLLTITTVIMASYAASVITIVGSMLLASHVPGTSLYKAQSSNKIAQTETVLCVDNNCDETIDNELITESIVNSTLELNETTEIHNQIEIHKMKQIQKLDPINVLTTSLILASIHHKEIIDCDVNKTTTYENVNSTEVTWDWWSNDLMNWLYEKSAILDNNEDLAEIDYMKRFDYGKRLDMTIANSKLLSLEDQVHKATTVRIQDQLENSWHKEWTDTILVKYFKSYSKFITPPTSPLISF